MAIFIPLAILLCFSKEILTAIRQEPEVIEHTHKYILICLPGIYLRSMFDMKKRFLNCLNVVQVPTLA